MVIIPTRHSVPDPAVGQTISIKGNFSGDPSAKNDVSASKPTKIVLKLGGVKQTPTQDPKPGALVEEPVSSPPEESSEAILLSEDEDDESEVIRSADDDASYLQSHLKQSEEQDSSQNLSNQYDSVPDDDEDKSENSKQSELGESNDIAPK